MEKNELATQSVAGKIEQAVILGDLSVLKPEERVQHYLGVCKSLGLNPLTRPFDYITLNGRLTLYAKKDATDQLRDQKEISIGEPEITYQDDWIIVKVGAHDKSGREDWDVGVVSRKDMRGDFGNAIMKAVTKAKRRVTLSICGLGMLDETEIETIPDAKPYVEVVEPEPPALDYSELSEIVRTETNSKGVLYINLPSDKLNFMKVSLGKVLADKTKSDDEQVEALRKVGVINDIIEFRSKQ